MRWLAHRCLAGRRLARGGGARRLALSARVLMAGLLTAGALTGLVAGSVLVTDAPAALAKPTASAAHASSGGGCDPYVDGTVIPVPCSSSGASGGATGTSTAGRGGGGSPAVTNTCTFSALSRSQAGNLGLQWPPPKGQHWALMNCPGGAVGTGPQAVLVSNASGTPQVTPQQLLARALGELKVPYLGPATAPPRGADGLVGLPEWFWVPAAQWHARTVSVSAGPVWATVTAAPSGLTVQPGAGQPELRCQGAGTPYDPRRAAAAQRSTCSYTYLRPSVGQPGNQYRASVTVTWRISWTGSGGAGGLLDAALALPVTFGVPVAQGEALVTSP